MKECEINTVTIVIKNMILLNLKFDPLKSFPSYHGDFETGEEQPCVHACPNVRVSVCVCVYMCAGVS